MPTVAKAQKPAPTEVRMNAARDFTNEQIINAATGRWGEVAGEIKPAEAYVIEVPEGEPIVIAPLTRRRRKKMKAAQATYMLIGAQLAEAQRDSTADQGTVSRIENLMEDAERAYDEGLFGDACQAVYDYFDDLQEEFWDAMYADIHNALVNRVELPEGTCPRCGQTVEDAEGKDESS